MKDFLVIGGGVSGLTTAHFLRKAGASVQVLEASDEPGGTMKSRHLEGFLVEMGPNSALKNNPYIDQLLSDLGLEDQYVEANDQAKRRYVLKEGQLHALPGSPVSFLKTPLFSAAGKWRLLKEPFVSQAQDEENVAQFVERRLGKEFLDWAIDPFVSGVYAGDPYRLSVQAATSKVYALERDFGSLIGGMIKKMLFNKHRGGAGPAGKMFSFRQGMGVLPKALANAMGEDFFAEARVDRLDKLDEGWEVAAGDQTWQAREVVFSTPAHQVSGLLSTLEAQASSCLDDIVYPHVASVALGFRRDQVEHALDGFGFLIPRKEAVLTLGALFSSTLFEGRAPEGHVLTTSFIGGRQNPAAADQSDAQLTGQVLKDLGEYLGVHGEPVFSHITRWQQAIPQYEMGYLQRLERIDQLMAAHKGLHFRANWREGISVGDCIRNAHDLAQDLTA